ncbi:hypothetical protein GVX82_02880 [Patescibacteria group bacterium]|jgi:hypothetical protein|nr:hypothetical protein [Patescibacteria group bacterium]
MDLDRKLAVWALGGVGVLFTALALAAGILDTAPSASPETSVPHDEVTAEDFSLDPSAERLPDAAPEVPDAESTETHTEGERYVTPSMPTLPPWPAELMSLEELNAPGTEWLERPVPRGALELIAFTGGSHARMDMHYFEIGSINGNALLVSAVPTDGLCVGECLEVVFLVEEEAGRSYRLLERMSSPLYARENEGVAYPGLVLDERVVRDGETYIEQLVPQPPYTRQERERPQLTPLRTATTEGRTLEPVARSPYGPVYLSLVPRDARVNDRTFTTVLSRAYIRHPGGLASEISSRPPFLSDDGVPQIIWSTGERNERGFRFDGLSGCGGFGAVEVLPGERIDREALRVIGYTQELEPVLAPRSPEHPLVERVFATAQLFSPRYRGSDGLDITSPEDVLEKRALFLWEDQYGRVLVFIDRSLGPQAECAKPVIYLYPEETTEVRVEVGARVTVSDPPYGEGWEVVAHPDGTLEHNGAEYDSLFWDGIGDGVYPAVSKGVIVPRGEVERTLTQHLTTFGFTDREQRDFLEYWLPRMPETPYVRLSWLGTDEMDTLAPLTVTPQPDTVIRVFLDYAGVESPYPLEPQRIAPFARNGYTLVEWGGLLVE